MLKTAKKDRVLYEFIIKKPVEKTIEISEKDTETGEEIVRKKKVETVEEINIRCLRPTRKNIEEAEFQYSLKLSECLNMGIMTKQMLYKKYTDTGGLYTNEIFKELTERYERQVEIKELFTLLSSTLSDKEDDELTEEEKNKIQELQKLIPEYGKNYQRILEIESEYDTLFTHTADKLAENHKLRYFIIKGTQIKNSNRNLNFELLFEFFSFFLKNHFPFYFSSFFIPAFSRIPFHICSRFFSRSVFPSFHFCINAICSRSSRSSINSLSFLHLFR